MRHGSLVSARRVLRRQSSAAGDAADAAHADAGVEHQHAAGRRPAVAARGQEHVAAGVVGGRRHAAQRHVRRGAGERLMLLIERSAMSERVGAAQVGLDRAGRDAVHPHRRRELVGQLADQPHHRVLGSGVERAAAGRVEAGVGDCEDQRAGRAHQRRQRRLGEVEVALDVDVEELVERGVDAARPAGRRARPNSPRCRRCRSRSRACRTARRRPRPRAGCRRCARTSPATTDLDPQWRRPARPAARACGRAPRACAPSSRNRSTIARPRPDAPPVISTDFVRQRAHQALEQRAHVGGRDHRLVEEDVAPRQTGSRAVERRSTSSRRPIQLSTSELRRVR